MTVAYDPDAPLGAALDTAGAESPTTDPNATNDEASASTNITGVSDVSIAKTATPLLVVAGGTVTYTLTVKNDGPSTAHDTVVTDTLPADVAAGTVTSDQGTCTTTDATVSCTLGDVAVGDSVDITIVADVDPGFPGGDLTNVSTVGTSNADPDPSDDTASFTNTSGAAADVAVGDRPAGRRRTGDLPPHAAQRRSVERPRRNDHRRPPGRHDAARWQHRRWPTVRPDRGRRHRHRVVRGLAALAVGQTVTGTLTLATAPTSSDRSANTVVVGAQAIDVNDTDNTSVRPGLVQQARRRPRPPPPDHHHHDRVRR